MAHPRWIVPLRPPIDPAIPACRPTEPSRRVPPACVSPVPFLVLHPARKPTSGRTTFLGAGHGMNTKLHAVTDAIERPIRFFLIAGQVSDYTCARTPMSSLPAADWLLNDMTRLASRSFGNKENQAVQPRPEVTRKDHPLRQATLQTAQLRRDHVRTPVGLPPRGHPVRPVPGGLPIRHSARRGFLGLAVDQ